MRIWMHSSIISTYCVATSPRILRRLVVRKYSRSLTLSPDLRFTPLPDYTPLTPEWDLNDQKQKQFQLSEPEIRLAVPALHEFKSVMI